MTSLWLSIVISVLVCALDAQVVDSRWSEPYRLSAAESDSERGHVVVDSRGEFHTVWKETRFSDQQVLIRYARFDGFSWSSPIQVHAAQSGFRIGSLDITIDGRDDLYVTWTESSAFPTFGDWPAMAPLMYTHVWAADALVVESWATPRIVNATAVFSTLRIDSLGNLHLVYTDMNSPQPGIIYTHSVDGGQTWSDPIKIDPEVPKDNYAFYHEFELDSLNGLHVVWEYKSGWQTTAIHYARSTDGGWIWDSSIVIDKVSEDIAEIQYGHPLLAVHNRTIHVVWAGGGFANVGRRHRYSTDAGQSWSVIAQLFGGLHGYIGGEALTVDPDGRLHLFDQMRWPAGLWHCYWDAGTWSEPSLLYLLQQDQNDLMGDRIHVHRTNGAVSRSQALVTFTNQNLPLTLFEMHSRRPLLRMRGGSSFPIPLPRWPRR